MSLQFRVWKYCWCVYFFKGRGTENVCFVHSCENVDNYDEFHIRTHIGPIIYWYPPSDNCTLRPREALKKIINALLQCIGKIRLRCGTINLTRTFTVYSYTATVEHLASFLHCGLLNQIIPKGGCVLSMVNKPSKIDFLFLIRGGRKVFFLKIENMTLDHAYNEWPETD